MEKKLQFLALSLVLLLTLLLLLPAARYQFTSIQEPFTRITDVTLTMNGRSFQSTLPLTLKDLPSRTQVSISFPLPADGSDTLFFGSVYSPLTIWANGELLYRYGQDNSYPSFFKDPPTQYDSLSLTDRAKDQITFTYESPIERSSLSLHCPLVGTGRSILRYLVSRYGVSFFMALFFLFLGAILMLSSCFFLYLGPNGILLPMGLLCFLAGSWQFGENTLSVFLLQCPSLLYLMDFLGLFILVIPLYYMGLSFLSPACQPLLKAVNYSMQVSVLAALLLQLTGRVSFHRSLYYFHILLPLAILLLTICGLYEAIKFKSPMTGFFFSPFLILTVAAILELVNYRVRFLPQFSMVFQLGLFLFILALAAFSFVYLRSLYERSLQNLKLENEVKLQEQTILAQKKRNELLLSNFEEVRRQRHDIRHHLRTLSEMLSQGEGEKAASYIQSLSDTIPSYTPEYWCENEIINATLSFYAQKAKENGIRLTLHAQIPKNNPHFSDANLCVVFGNLLENALEACQQLSGGSRFITLNAQVRKEVLFILMENSYNGCFHMENGRYYSSKRSGFGQGLLSIQSLSKTHDGAAHFQALENVFRSEVYFRL